MSLYGFIVDTNLYSGNFERKMCAFMTGHIGDCGVGIEEVGAYLEDYDNPIPHVAQVPDEYDCERPVRIIETPGLWNNGMGFHFKNGEEEIAIQRYVESTIAYYQQHKDRVESYRGKQLPTWSDSSINKVIRQYDKKIEEAKAKTEVAKYPAYQSVLIYFEVQPDEETIDFLKQRAYKFAEKNKGLEVTGFRLYEESAKTTTI